MSDDGQLITFYSYKGGTGRTMALANVACLMAREGRRVLAIDWDLEAPGLHRFLQTQAGEQIRHEPPGLIEMMEMLAADSVERGKSAIDDLDLGRFYCQTSVPLLYLMKAGRLDERYAERVRTFNWKECFDRAPTLFVDLAAKLASAFDYVLIDSRTGITDTGGVCTVLMPEKLVLVFTPNQQSLYGGMDIVRRATQFRISSDDVRPYLVYPLPSRVEGAEAQLRQAWRDVYQREFESLFRATYALDSCELGSYFDEVQIPHVSHYAYGEDIAVLREDYRDRLSLARSFDIFKSWLTDRSPWQDNVIDT
jgi:cellulose biosynthesis protein BcsQ